MPSATAVTTKATIASFGGQILKLAHQAQATGCEMAFNLFLPPQAAHHRAKVPLFIWLSGLTCTPDNCTEKGFLQHAASKLGIAILWPDTSPRGLDIKGQDDSYDLGTGAGFYVDATAAPWSDNYRMYTYITAELPGVVFAEFPQIDPGRLSISGHSMGGHGALSMYLKNPGMYRSCSAFAPISNPLKAPWGEKAFRSYFGEQDWRSRGAEHDSTELIKRWKGGPLDLLIDVGTGDNFYKQGQLLPENLVEAAKEAGVDSGISVRYQPDYDHSYFTIATFADDHIAHAAKYLFD